MDIRIAARRARHARHSRYRWLWLPLFSLVLAVPAQADDDDEGFYGRISVGQQSTSRIQSVYYDEPGILGLGASGGAGLGGLGSGIPPGSSTVTGQFVVKTSPAINAAMGYDFGSVRAEIEVGRSTGRITGFNAQSVNGTPVAAVTPSDAAFFCSYNSLSGCTASGTLISFPGGPRLLQTAVMASLWFDVPVSRDLVPYIGGGIGVTSLQVGTRIVSRMAWQYGGGMAWKLSDTFALTADYRHREVNRSAIKFDPLAGINFGKIKSDNFASGFRYKL